MCFKTEHFAIYSFACLVSYPMKIIHVLTKKKIQTLCGVIASEAQLLPICTYLYICINLYIFQNFLEFFFCRFNFNLSFCVCATNLEGITFHEFSTYGAQVKWISLFGSPELSRLYFVLYCSICA
jgi:hypothetical protein